MKKIALTSVVLGLALIGIGVAGAQTEQYSNLAQSHQMAPRTQMHFDFVSQHQGETNSIIWSSTTQAQF